MEIITDDMTPQQKKKCYNKRYYEKVKKTGKNQSVECPDCRGSYTMYTKHKHLKSKRHMKVLNKE